MSASWQLSLPGHAPLRYKMFPTVLGVCWSYGLRLALGEAFSSGAVWGVPRRAFRHRAFCGSGGVPPASVDTFCFVVL